MTSVIERGPRQRRAGRPDRPELRLDVDRRRPPAIAARERRRPRQPRPPDRGRRPRPRRRRRQPRLRADRLGLQRRIHGPRPVGSLGAQQGRPRLPDHVRHDRLDRQLPDRATRPPRAAPTPSWSWATTTGPASSSPVGSVAPLGGPSYDIGDTIRALSRPAARLQGHPRRAVLRPGLVDGDLGASTPRTSRARRTAPRRRSSTARPSSSPPITAASGTRSKGSPGPPIGDRTARRPTAASSRGASSTTTTPRRSRPEVRPGQPLRPARRRDLGPRVRRDAPRALRDAQGQVHHRQDPAGDLELVDQRVDHLPQRRPGDGQHDHAGDGHRAHPLRVDRPAVGQRRRRRHAPIGGRQTGEPPPSPGTARTAAARSSRTGRTGSPSGRPMPRTTAHRQARW